jgi:hypothetical protein
MAASRRERAVQQYQQTGGITFAGIGWGLGAGILSAFVFSILYVYATFYLPIMEASVFGAVILGVLTGLCTAKGASAGKADSRPAYLALGIVSGLFAVYFSWVLWVFAASGHKFLIFNPLTICRIAGAMLPHLAWEIHGKEIKGPALVLGWIAEAATITSIAAAVCRGNVKTFVGCPVCHARFRSATASRHYAIPVNLDEVTGRLRDFDFTCLSELTEVEIDKTDSFLTLEFYVCPACAAFGLLDLESLELITTTEGDVLSRRARPIDQVVIPSEKLEALLRTTSEIN